MIAPRTIKTTVRTVATQNPVRNAWWDASQVSLRSRGGVGRLEGVFKGRGVGSEVTGLAGGPKLGSAVPVKDCDLRVSAIGCSRSGARNEETSAARWDIWGGRERVQGGTMGTGHLLSSCRKKQAGDFISVCHEAFDPAKSVFVCSKIPQLPTVVAHQQPTQCIRRFSSEAARLRSGQAEIAG